ncbi:hypothetical protein [Mycoplasmopsis felis]|uniref:hypothetical protein n=1 Tax=Mycoplasmopsis felis TaxID=33923 RepID=UPI002B000E6B|nr:hypothetical protein [Mycoplasmopsis felis]WQQ10319.1 hypothetical protein RRG49_01085 [Mycoplasmopsis felis]
MLIQHNKDDSKLYERKQVISISKLRAKVDVYNRNIEIKNFKKTSKCRWLCQWKGNDRKQESKILQTN